MTDIDIPERNSATLLKQGAEARLHTCDFLGRDCLIKERFKKSYRHPTLDTTLTAQRLKNEVRALLRCRQWGISAPTLFHVDMETNCVYMEYLRECITLKDYLDSLLTEQNHTKLKEVSQLIGAAIGQLHVNNIVHGDLTTSNMLVRNKEIQDGIEIVFIDFGLTTVGSAHVPEDKGVDLYVLERAFLSTHPNTEELFEDILVSYARSTCNEWPSVKAKLDEIRLRGRKRTMVG